MALQGASFGAETGDRSDVTIDFNLHIGTVNERVDGLRGLNQLNLLGFVDDFAVVGDAGKIVAENSVEDGGVVELDGVGEADLEIGNGLAVGLLVGPRLIVLGENCERENEESENEQHRFFHGGHHTNVSFPGLDESVTRIS